MIRQEEINKAALCGTESVDRVDGFKAGAKWALEQIDKVTRFEVIDHSTDFKGRCYVKYGCSIELSLQDDNRTLKVFVEDK